MQTPTLGMITRLRHPRTQRRELATVVLAGHRQSRVRFCLDEHEALVMNHEIQPSVANTSAWLCECVRLFCSATRALDDDESPEYALRNLSDMSLLDALIGGAVTYHELLDDTRANQASHLEVCRVINEELTNRRLATSSPGPF